MLPFLLSARRACALCFCLSAVMASTAQLEDVSVDHLVEVSTAASWFGCGLSTVDFDGDGWDDVTAATSAGPVELYKGGPDGLGHHMTLPHDNESKAVLWVDVDNDGDLDLILGVYLDGLYLYIQDEDGALTEEGVNRGLPQWPSWDVRGISAADYDNDLDLDLYVVSYHASFDSLPHQNLLLRNEGGGHFTDQTDAAGVGNGHQHSFQGAWFDFDDDGDQDLWVINDRSVYPNALYRNTNGVFYDIAQDVGANIAIEAMSATLFDPDNDGDWDMYVTNIEDNPNAYLRNANGFYYDVSDPAGIASMQYGWGTLAVDLNGDMHEDLMVATYRFPNSNPYDNHLYMNDGAGSTFTDHIEDWPNEQYMLYCLGRLDLDQDRVPDIVGHGNAAHAQILRNTNPDGASRLTVDLVGTLSNSHAIGAVVKVWADGEFVMRQLQAGADYMTQHSHTLFFGLAGHDTVDSVQVRWPSGLEEVWYDVDANSALTLVEGVATASLTAIEGECPWDADRWLLPYGAETAQVTWNGAPFDGDTLVASGPGVQTFEASWWGGLATWTAEVEANFTEQPQWSMEALDPACHGEPGWVSWAIDEASAVFWNGDTLPVVGELDALEVGQYEFVAEIEPGCAVATSFSIDEPDSVGIDMAVEQPACHGETGVVAISAWGGTGDIVLDWGELNLEAATPGTYFVMATDSLGCQRMDSLLVVEPDSLSSTLTSSFSGVTDSALVELIISGGTPPYSIQWSGDLDEMGWVLAPASIGWFVQDANGCLDLGAVQIESNPLAGVSVTDGGFWSCLRLGESLRLDGNRTMQGDVEVYDLDGRLLGRWKALTLPVDLPLSTLSPVLVHMKAPLTGQSRVWIR